jgi:hypothetical protein
MGNFIKDALGFELFHGKDILKRIKQDPKRLLLGVDPASTAAWNKVLGRDDKPIVDQLGGAYDGHALSWKGDGGVYKRAEDAGIDTGAGLSLQRIAHVIASVYGAAGLGNAAGNVGESLQGLGGEGGGFEAPDWKDPGTYMDLAKNMPQQQQQQQPPPQPRPVSAFQSALSSPARSPMLRLGKVLGHARKYR